MHLYDTRRGQTAELDIPLDRPLTLYVCGVTPYDTTHIGHARTFLIFDVLVRYLRFQGAEVRYCQNVTDVDEPLFERAARDGISWQALAERETQRLVEDCAALNLLPPTYFPKASEEIPGMLVLIERLIALGHAYVRGGSVYYRVKSDPTYGEMAHMDYAGLLATANERGNDPDDPNKDDPLDFVLWRASRPGEPAWESPWGPGRPGWHIECTAMATRYLGVQVDIHGGGRDLIFPHHPSEIAQTEPVTGVRPFVRFWMHGGLAWLHGEKISKSLGNMVFVRDALKEHSADALRWYLLSFPYREDFSYERSGVVAMEANVERLRAAITAVSTPAGDGAEIELRPEDYRVDHYRIRAPAESGTGATVPAARVVYKPGTLEELVLTTQPNGARFENEDQALVALRARLQANATSAFDAAPARAAFLAALDDDLQTPLALALLSGLASDVLAAAAAGQDVRAAQATLRELAGVLGFWAAEQ